MLSRLQREWDVLCRRPVALQQARSWNLPTPRLTSLAELLVQTGLGRGDAEHSEAAEVANELLGRLVVVARGDDLAARVVLQRMLPGMSVLARRRSSAFRGHLDAFDELLSAAWMVIRVFPVERRPRHIAANLLRDTEYHAFRRGARRLLVHDYTEPQRLDQAIAETGNVEPLVELLELVRTAKRSYISDADLRLLSLLLSCRTTRDVADRLEVSERTVRNHRNAVVHRLRNAAAA